jgi:aquaporin Z
MADAERGTGIGPNPDPDPAAALGRRYLIRFEEDTLRSRSLWIRVIVEFVGTFLLVTVAAGAGVIGFYAGGHPISRTPAVYVLGDGIGALIAVALIGLVRGLPDKAETEAAEGGALTG